MDLIEDTPDAPDICPPTLSAYRPAVDTIVIKLTAMTAVILFLSMITIQAHYKYVLQNLIFHYMPGEPDLLQFFTFHPGIHPPP